MTGTESTPASDSGQPPLIAPPLVMSEIRRLLLGGVQERLDALERELGSRREAEGRLLERVEQLETAGERIREEGRSAVDGVRASLDALEARLGELLGALERDLASSRSELSAELDGLSRQGTGLDARLTEQGAQLSRLEGLADELRQGLAAVSEPLSALARAINRTD